MFKMHLDSIDTKVLLMISRFMLAFLISFFGINFLREFNPSVLETLFLFFCLKKIFFFAISLPLKTLVAIRTRLH